MTDKKPAAAAISAEREDVSEDERELAEECVEDVSTFLDGWSGDKSDTDWYEAVERVRTELAAAYKLGWKDRMSGEAAVRAEREAYYAECFVLHEQTEAQLKSCQREIGDLKAEVEILAIERNDARAEIERLRGEIELVQAFAENQDNRFRRAHEDAETNARFMVVYKCEMKKARTERAGLERELAALKEELRRSQVENESHRMEREGCREIIEVQQSELQTLRQRVAELEASPTDVTGCAVPVDRDDPRY